MRREAHAYIETWEGIRGKARLLLEALAKYEKAKVFSKDFISENQLGTPSSTQRAVGILEERGIIERQNGDYHVADVFLKAWLKQNIL